jgi:hypothetical protein
MGPSDKHLKGWYKMKVFIKHDIRDNLGELSTMADRVSVMLNDVLNDMLYPLDMGRESDSPLELATVAATEAHPATVKMEIADSVIEEMKDKLTALQKLPDPRPLKDEEIPYATEADHRYYKFTNEETRLISAALATQKGPIAERLKEVFTAFLPDERTTRPTEEAHRKEAEPVEDVDKLAEDEAREQMINEYMASINDFVSVIESKDDFIDRMIDLKNAARSLASGDNISIVSNEPVPW